ncbi:MAG: hypothetical protein KAT74_03650, partial [Candidatus Cloacimonetes bacterium]|nr:hypothetical protein [Candidatus Cloacimonadota bacterium]
MKKFIITTVILFMCSVIFAANLKLIYFHTQYNNVDITQLQHDNDLTAQYWILGRETEVDTVTTFVLNDT